MKDNRDPTLLMVEIASRRRPGEPLSAAADRIGDAVVPDHGTPEAAEAFSRHNGHVQSTNDSLWRH